MGSDTARLGAEVTASLAGRRGPLPGCGLGPLTPFTLIREQAMTTTQEPVIRPDRMWRDQAACRYGDAEAFFPAAEAGPEYEAQVALAKAVCAGCVVRAACLAWAMSELPYGIAGGMTEDERRQHRATHRPWRQRRPSGRPVGASAAEVAAAGRDAIRAGWSPRGAAQAFGVSERTAARWAAQARAQHGQDQEQAHEGVRG